jgi:hypothetical protein
MLTKTPNGPVNYYVINSILDFIVGWETELFSDPRELSPGETPSGRPPAVTRTRIPVDLPIKCVTALLFSAFHGRRPSQHNRPAAPLRVGRIEGVPMNWVLIVLQVAVLLTLLFAYGRR